MMTTKEDARHTRTTSTRIIAAICISLASFTFTWHLDDFYFTQTCDTIEVLHDTRETATTIIDHRKEVSPFVVDPIFQTMYDRIDNEDPVTKCARYNLQPYAGPRRRIFYGTMIADENWEVLHMSAIEVHGIYHTAVFVESNTTHMVTPRTMRFYDSKEKDMLMYSGMMGNNTDVKFYYWMEDIPDLKGMDRESEQRNTIVKGWQEAGMTSEDVGLMADVDEVFSRDFLRAIQVCDLPELRPGQTCHRPKIVPLSVSFESSPFCIKKGQWYHPDMISGECVDGIGDPSERVSPLRTFNRRYGERDESYGKNNLENYPDTVKSTNRFPLFSGADIRTTHGDPGNPYTPKDRPGEFDTAAYGAAFHFHNWFSDQKTLRHKYETYAHGFSGMTDLALSHTRTVDLDITVRCVRGIDNNANPNDWAAEYYLEGWKIEGPKPIFFLNTSYTKARHEIVRSWIQQDEAMYGSAYDADGKWVDLADKVDESSSKKTTQVEKETAPLELVFSEKEMPSQENVNVVEKVSAGLDSASENGHPEQGQTTFTPKATAKHILPENIPPGGHEESRNATVMGMATGLPVYDLSRFLNTLRNSGFSGNIIIGIEENAPEDVLELLRARRVISKIIKYANCTFEPFYKNQEEIDAEPHQPTASGLTKCAEAYPDVKVRWVKFPLGRDWLRDCQECTGPVLIADVRDTFFQADPFGPGSPVVTGLQVFQEHMNLTTEHWLVDWPVGDCKGVHLKKKPMLCSGTTIGTLDAMMKYLDAMYEEMKRWLNDPKCRFKTLADDQSIHNWLFYNGDLENAVSIANREGIVNTVGFEASAIWDGHLSRLQNEHNMTFDQAFHTPLEGANDRTWISPKLYHMTDEDGWFTNFDGSRSRVIHQWDRIGPAMDPWLTRQELFANQKVKKD